MIVHKERIPFWGLRKIRELPVAGEVLEEDGRDNTGTALCEILLNY
jgi:hypothetical protein